jgi:hypothetical protein
MPRALGSVNATDSSRVISSPSGEDALHIRRRYLSRRRSRLDGAWQRGTLWIVAVRKACSLGIAGFVVFVLGS